MLSPIRNGAGSTDPLSAINSRALNPKHFPATVYRGTAYTCVVGVQLLVPSSNLDDKDANPCSFFLIMTALMAISRYGLAHTLGSSDKSPAKSFVMIASCSQLRCLKRSIKAVVGAPSSLTSICGFQHHLPSSPSWSWYPEQATSPWNSRLSTPTTYLQSWYNSTSFGPATRQW